MPHLVVIDRACSPPRHALHSSALREQEEARASAAAAAAAVAEQAEAADALVKQRAEEAKENATAVGQLLLTLGLEQQNLKEQLAAAQSSRYHGFS